ncbi:hypothetical protein ACXWTF_05835 [Thiomicrolovo sp. ZZH C-3]
MKSFKKRVCPHCGSEHAKRRKRTFVEKYLRFKKRKYECYDCGRIYYT